MPGAAATARGLGRAAMALDSPAVSAILSRALVEDGPAVMWDGLLRPVLSAAGRRWEQTGEGVEVEHLLSECALGVLRAAVVRPRDGVRHRPVLVASAPGELHSLPTYALSAWLADSGVQCRRARRGRSVHRVEQRNPSTRAGGRVRVRLDADLRSRTLDRTARDPAHNHRRGWWSRAGIRAKCRRTWLLANSLHEARSAVLRAVSA